MYPFVPVTRRMRESNPRAFQRECNCRKISAIELYDACVRRYRLLIFFLHALPFRPRWRGGIRLTVICEIFRIRQGLGEIAQGSFERRKFWLRNERVGSFGSPAGTSSPRKEDRWKSRETRDRIRRWTGAAGVARERRRWDGRSPTHA